ncbi:MAG: cytochrome C oxidase subunit I [Actinomyces sp.]|nr:MAG: cytochrome C oxidase subunit I [Actinomyces sp.]
MTILEHPQDPSAEVDTTSAEPVVVEHPPVWRIDIAGVTKADLAPVRWQLWLAYVGFALGAAMGILQAVDRVDIDLYDQVGLASYYQGLTLHGVGLALIFTFCFANAFVSLLGMRAYGRPLPRGLSQAAAWSAWVGVALAGTAIVMNKATVLFTFYTPLQATPVFYIGAVLLVISTWLVLAALIVTHRRWRAEHPLERVPLLGYVSLTTYLMWFLASLGIAIEVLGWVLPFALGWRDTVDPQFTRILFWFTGHPIVYFWLLPIYISWYLSLPKLVGGKVYSDGLVRMVFLAFLILLPVGVHHQFTDPGIPFTSKSISWILTFFIFYPSTVTAFSVFASLEMGGRARGGKGLIGWIFKLPWGNPAVAGQLLAGIGFMLGGASGFINASYVINNEVHNTAFIVGHFHLTVGTGVALSIMAISYWMVPYLTGRALWGRRVALAQVWLWLIGVLTFSRGQMWGGIEGMPRRTYISAAPYVDAQGSSWDWSNALTAIGGSLMFISAVLFFVVIIATLNHSKAVTGVQEIPVAELVHGPKRSWAIVDELKIWAAVAMILTVIVYGEVIAHYWPLNEVARAVRPW